MKFGTPVCTFCLMTGTSNEHSAPHSWQVKSSLNTESTLIEAEKVSPDSMSLLSVPFTDASSGAGHTHSSEWAESHGGMWACAVVVAFGVAPCAWQYRGEGSWPT